MRVNMNKTKVMISGERQMVWQKACINFRRLWQDTFLAGGGGQNLAA